MGKSDSTANQIEACFGTEAKHDWRTLQLMAARRRKRARGGNFERARASSVPLCECTTEEGQTLAPHQYAYERSGARVEQK